MNERRPKDGWEEVSTASMPRRPNELATSAWQRGRIRVISSLVDAELPDGSGASGPQWHVSVSSGGRRPSPTEVKQALRAFSMKGAEEDNHHPGVARHFWLPVDPRARVECECKTSEVVVVEPDGYRWSNPREGECRGCEMSLLSGVPCRLHSSSSAVSR